MVDCADDDDGEDDGSDDGTCGNCCFGESSLCKDLDSSLSLSFASLIFFSITGFCLSSLPFRFLFRFCR